MSISKFTPALRQRIIEIYKDESSKIDLASYRKRTRTQIFKDSPETKQLRSKFRSESFHSSSLTYEGMEALTSKLIDSIAEEKAKSTVEGLLRSPNFFSNFVNFVTEKSKGRLIEYGSGDFRIEKIPEKNLRDYFVEYIRNNLKKVSKDIVDSLAENVQSGHLAGIFFLKLKVALGVTTTFSSDAEASYRDFTVTIPGLKNSAAVAVLDRMLKAVLDADYLTSNLVTNSQVFIDATKSVLGDNPSLITELQFAEDNEAAGDLLKRAGAKLNALIKSISAKELPKNDTSILELVQSLQPIVDLINEKVEELKAPLSAQGLYDKIKANAAMLMADMIDEEGSITLRQGVIENIRQAIESGKSSKVSIKKIKPKPIVQKHREILDISRATKQIEKAVKIVKKQIKKSRISKPVSISAVSIPSSVDLIGLQLLINSNLRDKIIENMGDGSSRTLLNNRTGRLASSARIEKLTMSRNGMITLFYSYMKYPYATFSAGGAQEIPKSRDPKLLISKSIREIAQEQVQNRLRAVLV